LPASVAAVRSPSWLSADPPITATERVHLRAALGRVPTGIAVASGAPPPPIHDADALRASFDEASALYCPDTERSTAGLHFVRMLREMGIYSHVAARIRDYANGAQAMAALAATSGRERAIGCTQVTEILYTPGVTLVGSLPVPFELTTTYSAAASVASRSPAAARRFVATDRKLFPRTGAPADSRRPEPFAASTGPIADRLPPMVHSLHVIRTRALRSHHGRCRRGGGVAGCGARAQERPARLSRRPGEASWYAGLPTAFAKSTFR
jgi:hypothetical protein